MDILLIWVLVAILVNMEMVKPVGWETEIAAVACSPTSVTVHASHHPGLEVSVVVVKVKSI